VNILLDNPMTQFSFGWILSLNWLCQKWGQVHYVSVESKNGNLIKGHLLSSDSTTLEIKPDGKKSTPMSIAYSDVQSVKRHHLTPSAKKTLILTAVVAGSVAGTLVLVCTARKYGCYDQ
jgi:hypothetical protein